VTGEITVKWMKGADAGAKKKAHQETEKKLPKGHTEKKSIGRNCKREKGTAEEEETAPERRRTRLPRWEIGGRPSDRLSEVGKMRR